MKFNQSKFFKSVIIIFFVSIFPLSAKINLPPIFSDNMVLQRNTETPIWGTAKAMKNVKIITSWDNQTYTTKADDEGHWQIKVKTPEAGGPYNISISDGTEIKLNNILIGEVWLCSGQSNMDMPLDGWERINNYEQEVKSADYPQIRLIDIKDTASNQPLCDVNSTGWNVCQPSTIANFSAVAYFFGRDIHEFLHVPVGLIIASWGGTVAEAWTSSESLEYMPDFKEAVNEIKNLSDEEAILLYERRMNEWMQKVIATDAGFNGEKAIWAEQTFTDTEWNEMTLPGYFERQTGNFDGVVWFRKTVKIPGNWKNQELELALGAIDDNDISYFNGYRIGETNNHNQKRIYKIPANLVTENEATITVRVEDTGGDGGFHGNAEDIYIKKAIGENSAIISLADNWKYKAAVDYTKIDSRPQHPLNNPNRPSVLFNGMIHPLVPYAIQGAIWYQGESNELRPYQYRELFPLMIRDWRKQWDRDFPFYFVQLANFRNLQTQPSESGWAELREAQLLTLQLDNTGMAVAIDIGDAYDIHPKNKQEVGRRLALNAIAKTYGEKLCYSGPVYQSHVIEGDKIRIRFQHTQGGLKAENNKVRGFSIAGPDHQFHWADAVIDKDEIVVSSPEVAFPVAVRYGWADNPDCNLYNGENLPASPFRTDDWR